MDKFISSGGVTIKIDINEKKFEDIVNDEFFYAYIPDVRISNNLQNSYDAEIKIIESLIDNIEFNYPIIIFKSKKMNTKDVISLIEFVFERARQEKGIICIHGASAIVSNKAIICWGPATGMGKTTLALELSKKGYFYSDEKVLIDLNNATTIGGISRQYLSNTYWKNKFGNQDYIVHNNTASKQRYEIFLFVYGIICNQNNYIYDNWEDFKFFWHLYEESSRKIRGTSRLFFDFSYPVPSLDTYELSVKRLELIKTFVKKVKSVYYKGSTKIISDKINSLL